MYSLYFYLKRKDKQKKEKGIKNNRSSQKIIDYIEWFYNVLLKKRWENTRYSKMGITKDKRKQKIIVSLTSFPKRIDTVWLTIETLLRQNMKPDEIILWLAEEQFPNRLDDLPESLLNQQARGLTIRFCDDLRSHKKYFYAMQEYPEDLIILADDDMFYPRDTVQKLFKLHKEYPDDICCITAQVITDYYGKPSEWRNPNSMERLFHSDQIQVFTGSGSLFPPKALKETAFNKNLIKELCPYADDLWLTFLAHLNETYITAYYPWRAFPITIYGTAKESLYYINAEGGQNDIQWKKMLDYFYDDLKDYIDV